MTLVITLGNEDQFIQLSDRRISSGRSVISDESNKATIFRCKNGRFVVGFSGLAQAGSFKTRDWILDALFESAKPDYLATKTLHRFNEKLSTEFLENKWLKNLHPKNLRLSIIFSGYLYNFNPPLIVCAILTNFQDFDSGIDNQDPWTEFRALYQKEKRPYKGSLTYIQRIGLWPAVTNNDISELRKVLIERADSTEIINHGVDKIRSIADRPKAQGLVGKQISSITVPRNLDEDISSDYHSNKIGYSTYMPSIVFAMGKGQSQIYKRISVTAQDSESTMPIVVPKVSKNEPCPCGSTLKYKNCHGKKYFKDEENN
ncbi:MAG: SEC-C domain-containing protein [Anaerolineales bacterium]